MNQVIKVLSYFDVFMLGVVAGIFLFYCKASKKYKSKLKEIDEFIAEIKMLIIDLKLASNVSELMKVAINNYLKRRKQHDYWFRGNRWLWQDIFISIFKGRIKNKGTQCFIST
jgi:hypothetical protein